jgi:16S rRNA (uracil1498-N3)-methyltransferase
MQRFHVAQELRPGGKVAFSAAQAKQIARVLRLAPGDRIEAFDGAGTVAEAVLLQVAADTVSAAVVEAQTVPWPDPWRPALYLAVVRPQRFEWAIEKAVELGVWTVTPLRSQRVTHGEGERRGRWQRLAVEAAEQCGAAHVPRIGGPIQLEAALRRPAALRLFACEGVGDAGRTVGDAVDALVRDAGGTPEVALFVGPEGGFTESERFSARGVDCVFVTLGPRVLRSETAAVALLAQLGEAALRRRQA